MEEKKRKNTWVDVVVLVLAVGIGQMVSEALPLSDEMVKFLIAALVAGVLIVLFYMLRYWLTGRK